MDRSDPGASGGTTVYDELVRNALAMRRPPERPGDRRLGSGELVDVVQHGPVLEALLDEPMDRREIESQLDVSKATSHRFTRWLTDRGFAEKVDGRFRLTGTGEVVAEEVLRLERNVQTADDLAPLLDLICADHKEFVVEPFADATVTEATPEAPYAPVDRFVELLRASSTFRGFNTTPMLPLSVETFAETLFAGTDVEQVYLPATVERLFEVAPERARAAVERGDLTLLTREALPYGLAIFDDAVAIGGYDEETGTLRVLVDTDDAIGREWAERTYAVYRSHADPLTETTLG
ncbi:helix-turn-helix transcriptional regulator [Halorarius litoreus]|uniref:helix-turn-helix transcriptional regulator n=1 Tax=Halorarius litoreus TaxID=2962676 RepID=UPI0020CBD4A3|nr:MarR family transcriptional regulator [Halorarius litoreus]